MSLSGVWVVRGNALDGRIGLDLLQIRRREKKASQSMIIYLFLYTVNRESQPPEAFWCGKSLPPAWPVANGRISKLLICGTPCDIMHERKRTTKKEVRSANIVKTFSIWCAIFEHLMISRLRR